jgi:beta-lactamase class A
LRRGAPAWWRELARRGAVAALLVALTALRPLAGQAAATGGTWAMGVFPNRADTAVLARTLTTLADRHHGVVGYLIRDLDAGWELARRADEPFPTASLIKVPVLVTVFDLIGKGRLSLEDRLTVLPIDVVPGAGVLQHLHPGLTITVRDAAWLMTTISDNTATNLLLDRILIRRVWETMEALGLPRSKVHSKTFLRESSVAMDSSVKYGLGVTTPREMARLFALLADGRAVSPAADSVMLDMLAANEDQQLLQRFVEGVRAPHKTGATDAVRTECTVWYLRSRVVACVLTRDNADTRWVLDSEPQLLLARIGEAVVGALRD